MSFQIPTKKNQTKQTKNTHIGVLTNNRIDSYDTARVWVIILISLTAVLSIFKAIDIFRKVRELKRAADNNEDGYLLCV